MDIQRLRNLTTHRLHTKMSDIYEDIEYLTGIPGAMTHQLPNINKAMQPWLMVMISDDRFWDKKYDTNHTGEYYIQPMNSEEQKQTMERFGKLLSPLLG